MWWDTSKYSERMWNQFLSFWKALLINQSRMIVSQIVSNQVSPLFSKKDDSLDKSNYRSVIILTLFSKVCESLIYNQPSDYAKRFLNVLLSMTYLTLCAEDLNPPSIDNPGRRPPSPFIFFPNPPLLARLFQQYWPIKIPEKNNNKLMWQGYFFIFRRQKKTSHVFFINSTWDLIQNSNNLKYQKESKEK